MEVDDSGTYREVLLVESPAISPNSRSLNLKKYIADVTAVCRARPVLERQGQLDASNESMEI